MRHDKILPSEIRRRDRLLREVGEQHPFDRPKALLARVDGPCDQQRLVTAPSSGTSRRRTRTSARSRPSRPCGGRASAALGVCPYPQWPPIAVPVVIRPGPEWWSWDEREVWLGLRYGSNLCEVLHGDVLTVTARGWISHLDQLHGSEPRAVWAGLAEPRAKAAS